MKFHDACLRLQQPQLQQLQQELVHWEKADPDGSVLVDNLREERFLEGIDWDRKFDFFLQTCGQFQSASTDRWDQIKNDLRPKYFDHLALKGGWAHERDPRRIGTVVPRHKLEKYLLTEHFQHFRSIEDIDRFLREFARYRYLPRGAEEFFVKKAHHLIWMTWQESDDAASPFHFVLHDSAEVVRVVLGLGDEKFQRGPLLGFVFRLDDDAAQRRLHRPTFCDANFCRHFRPGGRTHPLNGGQVKIDGETRKMPGQPEAVGQSNQFRLGQLEELHFFSDPNDV